MTGSQKPTLEFLAFLEAYEAGLIPAGHTPGFLNLPDAVTALLGFLTSPARDAQKAVNEIEALRPCFFSHEEKTQRSHSSSEEMLSGRTLSMEITTSTTARAVVEANEIDFRKIGLAQPITGVLSADVSALITAWLEGRSQYLPRLDIYQSGGHYKAVIALPYAVLDNPEGSEGTLAIEYGADPNSFTFFSSRTITPQAMETLFSMFKTNPKGD